MNESEKKRGLVSGSVPRGMILFAFPIFLSNLFQQLYNAVDTLIVGNFLGAEALAAVGSSANLIFLMTGFVMGVSLGAGVVIARYFGAGERERLSLAVHTTVALGIAAGIVLTIFGVFATPTILKMMGTPPEVMPNSIAYFRVYFLGCSSVVMYNCGSSILQSVGDSKSPMKYLITASLLNVVLDLLFIAVFHLGVASAAFATVLSQTVSATLAFVKLGKMARKGEAYGVRIRSIRFDLPMLKAIIRQGVPSGVQNSVISIANVVVQSKINSFGAFAMAGCGSYSKIEGFAFLPVTCFSMALATFVSQNIGAKKPERVRRGMRFGLACSMLIAELIGLGIWFFAPQLIRLFNSDPQVIAYGVRDCRTVSLFYALLAFNHCCAGILRGQGRPAVPMAVMLCVWCVLRITYLTVILHFIHEIVMVFWAYPLTWSISGVIFSGYLLRQRNVREVNS